MNEGRWISSEAWNAAKGTFDPLTAPLGYWAMTPMIPTEDCRGPWDYDRHAYVCCGVPPNAIHPDHCPQTPIWAAMCAEHGNPLHIWAFAEPTLIFELYGGHRLYRPRYRVSEGSWTIVGAGNRKGTTPSLDLLQEALRDADLTLNYRRVLMDNDDEEEK